MNRAGGVPAALMTAWGGPRAREAQSLVGAWRRHLPAHARARSLPGADAYPTLKSRGEARRLAAEAVSCLVSHCGSGPDPGLRCRPRWGLRGSRSLIPPPRPQSSSVRRGRGGPAPGSLEGWDEPMDVNPTRPRCAGPARWPVAGGGGGGLCTRLPAVGSLSILGPWWSFCLEGGSSGWHWDPPASNVY